MENCGGMECCAITELADFALDGTDDYTKELQDEDRAWLREYRSRRHPTIACVNSSQLTAKKMLEDAGFFVAATVKSEEDGRPIYFMARGIRFKNPPRRKSPRRERG